MIHDQAEGYALSTDGGERIENLGLRLLATADQTAGALMAAECTNVGPGGPPLHSHEAIDEFYYVLRGRYGFQIGRDRHEGGPGTFVFIPRGASHTFASVSEEEGKILAFTLPAFDGFIRGISELQTRGFDQVDMIEHFHAFQSEIDGPPLTSPEFR
jgi:mannose-6-phosphate isomerase-like protein (cupin superfamily)